MMDDVAAKARQVLEKIEAKVEDLRNKINAVLSKVPGVLSWVVDKILDAWNAFCQKMQQFWDWFTDKLAYVGSPGALSDASSRWHQEVGGPVSVLSHDVDAGDLRSDDAWSGSAAEQYRQKVPEQQSAMQVIRDLASLVASGLDTMRNAIIVFWGAVAIALLSFVGGLAGAITATGTILGAPAAPVIAGAAALVCLASLGVGVWSLNSAATSARNSMTQASTTGPTSWPVFSLS